IAPLGLPVVPAVYWMWQRSSIAQLAARIDPGAEANEDHATTPGPVSVPGSATQMTCERAGAFFCTSATIRTPRESVMIAHAPASLTACNSSSSWYTMFVG